MTARLTKYLILTFGYWMLNFFFSFSQPNEVDSLKQLLQNASHDTARLRLYVSLSDVCNEEEILSFTIPALQLADKLLKQEKATKGGALKNKILSLLSLALNNIGIFYRQTGKLDSAMNYYKESMKIRSESGDKRGIVESLNNIGDIYSQQGNFPMTLEYYLKGLKILEENGIRSGLSASYHNIGYVYLQQNDFDKALEYLNKSLKNNENKMERGFCFTNIGNIYNEKKDAVNAMKYFQQALKDFEEINYKRGIASAVTNMGAVYYNLLHDKEKGDEYYTRAMNLWEAVGDLSNLSKTLINLSAVYYDKNEKNKAMEYALRAMELAKQTGFPENIKRAAQELSILYKAEKKYKEALEMRELFIQMRDSIFNAETQKSTFKQQTKYDYEKQQALSETGYQKELAVAEEEKKRQNFLTYSIAAGLLLVIAFAVFILNRLRITRKQKQIIEQQKQIVDQKNKLITYSINYAKRIQDSILPSKEELAKCFSEHFIFFLPKEIVSGDFYWLSNQSGKTILAIADCTGHGVPGAFMSMIGNTLLNEIVNEKNIYQPAEILNLLNVGIVKALHQESRSQDDGMDISVCLFEKNKITFAGANHSMYVIKDAVLQEVKGDIYSIGSAFGKKDFSFSQKELSLYEKSTIYFSTDGLPDQLGGKRGKKFLSKNLQKLLLSVSDLEIKEQEEKIKNAFNEWRGSYAQLDDILLAGIKI